MPEKTKTGKWIFPIRDASAMKKEGWFIRQTNTEGVSVRLARLKIDDTVVVQAYIFDTKKGWDLAKAKKWLKDQGINWLAALDTNEDTFSGKCLNIVMVISGDDMPALIDAPLKPKKDKKRMVKTPKKNKEKERVMKNDKEEVVMVAADGSELEPTEVNKDDGLPKKIEKKPKRIVTHRSKKKGSNGKPLNLNVKDYGKKSEETVNDSELSNNLDRCGSGHEDKDKDEDKDKKKRMVRTPKKK